MACAGCLQRRQSMGRAWQAVKTGSKPVETVKREAASVGKSALSGILKLARKREAK